MLMALALTPDQILAAPAAEPEALGPSCFLLPFDKSRQNLQTSYVSMKPKAPRVAEKLAGSGGEVKLPVDRLEGIDLFHRLVSAHRTVYVADPEEPIGQALPGLTRIVAGQIARVLGLYRASIAPLSSRSK